MVQFLHIRGVWSWVEFPIGGECDAGFEGDIALSDVADYLIAAVALRQGDVDG